MIYLKTILLLASFLLSASDAFALEVFAKDLIGKWKTEVPQGSGEVSIQTIDLRKDGTYNFAEIKQNGEIVNEHSSRWFLKKHQLYLGMLENPKKNTGLVLQLHSLKKNTMILSVAGDKNLYVRILAKTMSGR